MTGQTVSAAGRLAASNSSVAVVVYFTAVLTLAGCTPAELDPETASRLDELESKVEVLEDRNQELEELSNRQDRKVRKAASVSAIAASSAFGSPLDRFFDAQEFWEVVYEDSSSCHARCGSQFRQMKDSCAGEEEVDACELDAAIAAAECHDGCPSPAPPPVPE